MPGLLYNSGFVPYNEAYVRNAVICAENGAGLPETACRRTVKNGEHYDG